MRSLIETITSVSELKKIIRSLKEKNTNIGFVPTMGYLHEGHLSLVRQSKEKCDITFVSIFVNPSQFAPAEDLSKYPRDIERDSFLLQNEVVDYLFFPTADEIYSNGFSSIVDVGPLTQILEGEFRPTHFCGVTTVVSILFNLVQPDYAFFGQKDAQQVAVIKKMVKDLNFNVEIVVCPIIREKDGLAMSSRNVYLSLQERKDALVLSRSLNAAKKLIDGGEKKVKEIIEVMTKIIISVETTQIDYVKIVNSNSFEEEVFLQAKNEYFILIACRIGKTRLIDNLLFKT